jgi:hypothetical protein
MKQLIITPNNWYEIDEEKVSLPSDNELKQMEILYTLLIGKSPFADGKTKTGSNYTKPKKRRK